MSTVSVDPIESLRQEIASLRQAVEDIKPAPASRKFVSEDEVSEITGLSKKSVRRIRDKYWTIYRPVRGRVLLALDEVLAYMESTSTATPRKGRGIRRAS